MTSIGLARMIVDTKTAYLARPRKDDAAQLDVKPWPTGSNKGWVLVDLFTASMIVAVYEALSVAHQEKFVAVPLPRVVKFVYKVLNDKEAK